LLSWLIDPLSLEFMRNALLTAILTGALCGVTGVYLVVQRMSLLSDVISHSVFPGLAIAFFYKVDIFFGAFISGIFSTFIVTLIRAQSKVKVDAAMAIVFSSFFALGILLINRLATKVDLHSFLFGNILSVGTEDVWRTAIVVIVVFSLIKIFYKELLLYTFDPQGARVMGLPVRLLDFGLMFIVTLTIVSSLRTVGGMLAISLLITPGTTAYLLVKQLHLIMGLAAGIGVLSSISGMYISYYIKNLPSGPAIALVASSIFLLVLLFSPSQGILMRLDIKKNLAKIFIK
jgi:manganese/iron transport system permease protein